MRLEEFVKLDSSQIRRDEKLMRLFVDFYEAAFSFKPKCAGCSFASGFKKLRQFSTKGEIKITNFETMEKKTFQLKRKYWGKILSFKKDGIMHRKYGSKIDEDFARNLVEAGQEDLFDKLPKVKKGKKVSEKPIQNNFEDMDYRKELLPLYAEISEATGKFAKSKKKNDVIAFLLENED